MNKQLVSFSKFLSLVLRHQPEVIGIQLDAEGWLSMDELIENSKQRGTPITRELRHEFVVAYCCGEVVRGARSC